MNQTIPRRTFEYNLEALRGIAALIVVLHHALVHPFSIDPGYAIDTKVVNTLPGHSSVLLFFILSGYVIGLTNLTPLRPQTILPYLRKRFVRLYPIYAISLLFTMLIALHHYTPFVVAGNFLFLQNAVVPVIWENNPLWSLNNEVLYYLLFIPVSLLRLKAGWVCIAAVVLGVVAGTVLQMPLLSSYCFGFVFWASGLWLAQTQFFLRQFSSPWLLMGLVFLFLGFEFINPLLTAIVIVSEKLSIHFADSQIAVIDLMDLMRLPFCFYIFIRFTNHTFKGSTLFTLAVIGAGLYYYLHIGLKYGWASQQAVFLLAPIVFFAIGIVLVGFAKSQRPPTMSIQLSGFLLKLGAISYGVYVIHFPIGTMLSHIQMFSGSLFTFCCRLVLDLVIVLAVGYLLEMKIQPWFKRYLSSPQLRAGR